MKTAIRVQRRQSNNVNVQFKTIESKHFIHYLKRFPQTLFFCLYLPISIKTQLSLFSYSGPKFECLYIFKNSWLFPWMQTFISLVLHFLFKWPRQEAKTKQHSQQQEAKKVRQRTAISQRDFFWRSVTGTLRWLASLNYLLYFLAFDWLRPAVLFFLNWTVCLYL